jgi:cytochrome c-type biogenesis protein CcmH/NrfG
VLLIWATSKKPQPVTIPQESSLTDKLQEIQKLKDQGLLTDEEFEAKKKQILNL